MNTLDPRLKHIIREQLSLLSDDAGKRALVVFNIERAWREMPVSYETDYLEETRLDEPGELDVNENSAGGGAHISCCPIGHPGMPGPQGVK